MLTHHVIVQIDPGTVFTAYYVQCRRIDCEQSHSSINQQMIAGCFGHEGLCQLHTKQLCTQLTKKRPAISC